LKKTNQSSPDQLSLPDRSSATIPPLCRDSASSRQMEATGLAIRPSCPNAPSSSAAACEGWHPPAGYVGIENAWDFSTRYISGAAPMPALTKAGISRA
jgi:hypothetical protein